MIRAILIALSLCLILGTGEAHSKEEPIVHEPEVESYEVEEGKANEEMVVPKQDTFDEMAVEAIEKESDPVIETPVQKYFDVPLSTELQDYIFQLCDQHNIAPGIIMAMIERESSFKADAVGDSGNSLGLMQIQPRWSENQEKMERLGCHNLLDPFQNVTVGINIVAELKAENADLYWVLMSYNGGRDYGTRMLNAQTFSDYAVQVVARASELNEGRR